MKKFLLTLLVSLVTFTSFGLTLNAEEQPITKQYLKETIGMSDEEIIGSGLAYVYDVGDEITIPLSSATKQELGNNINIDAKTKWDVVFEVVGKGNDQENEKPLLTLISKDALPLGTVPFDSASTTKSGHYSDTWIHNILNTNIYSMFPETIKSKIVDAKNASKKTAYDVKKQDSEEFKDVSTDGADAVGIEDTSMYVWLPSFAELGYGTTYSVDDTQINALGQAYTAFETTPKSATVLCNDNQVEYWLRESFRNNNVAYTLNTKQEGSTYSYTNKTDTTIKKGVVIGIDVRWSYDTQNGVIYEKGGTKKTAAIQVRANVASTYAVDLPETVYLQDGLTQFTYSVSGDLVKDDVVKVYFSPRSPIIFTGGFTKDNIMLHIYNDKVAYDRVDCEVLKDESGNITKNGTTSTVSIKNEKPITAGSWIGSLPITISYEKPN